MVRDQIANNTLPKNMTAAMASRLIGNDMLDAFVAGFFLLAVIVIVGESARSWIAVINKTRIPRNSEIPYSRVVETSPSYGD